MNSLLNCFHLHSPHTSDFINFTSMTDMPDMLRNENHDMQVLLEMEINSSNDEHDRNVRSNDGNIASSSTSLTSTLLFQKANLPQEDQDTQLEPFIEQQLQRYKLGVVPKATAQKRLWAVTKFDKWQQSRKFLEGKDLQHFSEQELIKFISLFIIECSNEMRPKTLLELVLQIQQYLNESKMEQVKFLSQHKYKQIKNTLDARMRELSSLGNNKPPIKSSIITYEQENTLWEQGKLGIDTPQKLLATLIYQNGVNFALRISEHQALTIDNFEVVTDHNNRKILWYREFTSKNHNGGLKDIKKN